MGGLLSMIHALIDSLRRNGGGAPHDTSGPDCWCAPELWALCTDCFAESDYCATCGGYGMLNVGREDYELAADEGLGILIHRSFSGVDV